MKFALFLIITLFLPFLSLGAQQGQMLTREDMVEIIRNELNPQRGTFRAFTINDIHELSAIDIEKLDYYLSTDLYLSSMPSTEKKVENGILVSDYGNKVEYLVIPKNTKGKFKLYGKSKVNNEYKDIFIVEFKEYGIKLYFVKNNKTNMFDYHGNADGIKYTIEGQRPYLCIIDESINYTINNN